MIEGVPVAMSPLPTRKHQRVGGRLFAIFDEVISKGHCKNCTAYPPIDWKVKEDTVLQPDFLVVCGEFKEEYLDFPPVLVAEILSPSTAIKDRNAKFAIYEAQKVKYYLILDISVKKIEIYQLTDDKYQPVSISPAEWDFQLQDNCSTRVSFSDLWD